MALFRRSGTTSRRQRRKRCEHFEKVVKVCDQVVAGEIPPSDLGTKTLAEEYLLLYLEFEALRREGE